MQKGNRYLPWASKAKQKGKVNQMATDTGQVRQSKKATDTMGK